MSDQYTEVTSTGYFQRLGGSIVGVLIGIVLVPVSVCLLYWNEGRAVEAIAALDQAARQVVEIKADPVDAAANGHVVHLSGDLTASDPAKDPQFGVTGKGLVRLRRVAEMYQWEQKEHEESQQSTGGTKTTTKTYTYEKDWSEAPVDSGSFKVDGHRNPAMTTRTASFDGGDAKLGAYRLDPAVLDAVNAFTRFEPGDTEPVSGWRRDGGGFYLGADPANPAVGDQRVTFQAIPAQTLSVVAALADGTLAEFHGAGNYRIALAEPGIVSADQLFAQKKHEENTWTWICRGIGFGLMLIGFLMIAAPVATVLAFLPFLEGIAQAGTFLIALTLSIPLTLLVIAIAWIAHRPLIGGGLIVAAIAAFVLFRKMHRKPEIVAAAKPTAAFMPPGMSP